MSDYSNAEWRPTPNFWNGYDARDFIVVHATASGNSATEYVPNFDAATGKSTHYAIALDGHVVQYVSEHDSAWGNCCVDGNSTFRSDYNWNKSTVSIENEKHSDDNSTPLTPAQYASLLSLVRDIAKRWNIPLVHGQQGVRGIIYHHDLMPIQKALCPGNFPYATFFADLAKGGTPVSANPEVCTFPTPINQLEAGETADACVAFGCATIYYSGPPDGVPSGTGEQIDQLADQWYVKEVGDIHSSSGLSTGQEYDILKGMGLRYVPLAITATTTHESDHNLVVSWLQKGVPVLICGVEDDFYDVLDGDQVPYGWRISANHAIVASGLAPNGNFYVRDYLNVSLPRVVPGSRRIYDASKMFLISGTAIYAPWMQGELPVGTPQGWHDDGTTLTAPNGIKVVLGFRTYILTHPWDALDVPKELEHGQTPLEEFYNQPDNTGTQQIFNFTTLNYSAARGVYKMGVGNELLGMRNAYKQLLAQPPTGTGIDPRIPQVVNAIQQVEAIFTDTLNLLK